MRSSCRWLARCAASAAVVGTIAVATVSALQASTSERFTALVDNVIAERATAAAPDGSAFWGGKLGAGDGASWAIGYDPDGGESWRTKITKPKGADIYALAVSGDSASLAVAGVGEPPWLAVLSTADGKEAWRVDLPFTPTAVAFGPSGSLYVTGGIDGDLALTRVSGDGEVVWTRLSDAGASEFGSSVAVDPRKETVLVAGTSSTEADRFLKSEHTSLLAVGYTAEGDEMWDRVIPITGTLDARVHAAVSPNGKSLYVAGVVTEDLEDGASLNRLLLQRFVVKTGKPKQRKLYDPTGDGNQILGGLGVSPNGKNVWIGGAGRLGDFPVPYSTLLLRINPRGKLLETSSTVILGYDTTLTSFHVDGQGDLVYGGYYQTTGHAYVYFLRKERP